MSPKALKSMMREVGELIALTAFDYETRRDEITERVDALCRRFPIYE